MSNIPITPLKHLDLNQCPKCEGTMVLLEKETSTIFLNSKGIPDYTDNLDSIVELKLVCTNCGNVYDAEKEGIYYRIKRSTKKISKPMKDYNPFYTSKPLVR